jgi:hypothetical protein
MPRNPWDLGRLGNYPPIPEEDRVLEWRQLYELGSLGRLMMRGRPQQPRSAPGGWAGGGPVFEGDWYFGGMPETRPFQRLFEQPGQWEGLNRGRLRHQNEGQSLRRETRTQESGGAAGTNSAGGGPPVASEGGAGASATGPRVAGNSGSVPAAGGNGPRGEVSSDARQQSCATIKVEGTGFNQQSIIKVTGPLFGHKFMIK